MLYQKHVYTEMAICDSQSISEGWVKPGMKVMTQFRAENIFHQSSDEGGRSWLLI